MSPNPRKRAAPGDQPIFPIAANGQAGFNPAAQQDQLLQWNGALPDGFGNLSQNANNYMAGNQGQFFQQQLRQQAQLQQLQQAQAQAQQVQQQQNQQLPLQSAQPQQLHIQPQPIAQQVGGQIQPQPNTSTAIARRPPNRALIPSGSRTAFDPSVDWSAFGDDAGMLTANPNNNVAVRGGSTGANVNNSNNNGGGTGLPGENESIEVLEERAQRIKKDAQAKRKQIPPFVQKLSSFLEEAKNTELIRWSENGDSFIVLDEDEFAKTLIPELFKHNNYASFVRQLNMYGFHKRVGLSDNSMKASERKNKSPSEYYNPYFRRGHPNLLWLINKPKSGSKAKRGKKEDGEGDSDEEVNIDEPSIMAHHASIQGMGNQQGRGYAAPGSGMGVNNNILGAGVGGSASGAGGAVALDANGHASGELGPLQKKDFQIIKDELSTLQTRQAQISKVMQRLQYDNAQLQQQARLFQNMHERHENSINAILNFLANVFRKSLEEQGGVQGVTELLASILPNGQMPTGSVVDLSDDFDPRRPAPQPTNLSTPPMKRQQRLLPPIPASSASTTAASTPQPSGSGIGSGIGGARSGSARSSSVLSPNQQHQHLGAGGYGHAGQSSHQPAMGSVTELFDSPGENNSYIQHELQSNPQEGMMRIINDTNANTPASGSAIDLLEAAAGTPANMSTDQRDRVIGLMNTQGNNPNNMGGQPQQQQQPNVANLARNSPMTGPGGMPLSPQVPMTIPATAAGGAPPNLAAAGAANTSLSPILGNMQAVPPPSLQDISNTQSEIEALQRLQDEQNAKISDLTQMLGPLSPSGRVPGIDEDAVSVGGSQHPGMQSPGYFDLGQYLDSNAFGDDFNFATDDLTGANAAGGAGGAAGQAAGGAGAGGPLGDDFNFAIDHTNVNNAGNAGNNNNNNASTNGDDDGGNGLFGKSPSPALTEEITRTDLSTGNSPDPAVKRRRVS